MKEFRAFILRGNVVDLAVGVVLGVAFGAVITSLVEDILTPLLGVFGTPDFSDLSVSIGAATMTYGNFINNVISFLLAAVALFLFVVKPMSRLSAARKTEPQPESTTHECPFCLSSIPRKATRCLFCTSEVTPAA